MKKLTFICTTTLTLTLTLLSMSALAQMSPMPPMSQNPESDRLKVETALKDCRQLAGDKEDSKEFNDCMLSKGFMKPPGSALSLGNNSQGTPSTIPSASTPSRPK